MWLTLVLRSLLSADWGFFVPGTLRETAHLSRLCDGLNQTWRTVESAALCIVKAAPAADRKRGSDLAGTG